MPKNVTNNGASWGVVVLIIAVLLVGLYATGAFKSVGTSAPGTTYTPSGGGVSCPTAPATAGLPRMNLLAGYLNQQNNGQNTTAAITVNLTSVPSPGYSYQNLVTSATTYVNSSSLGLTCGKTYTVIFAGGSDTATGYYPQQVTVGPIGANQTTVPFVALQKMAQLLAPQFSNSSVFAVNGSVNGITPGSLVTAGATYSNLYFIERAGAGSYGGSGQIFLLAANTVAISGLSVIGPNGQSLPSVSPVYPSTMNVPAGFTVYGFLAPPISTWSSTVQYQLVVHTSSAFAGNTGINLGINDLPGFIQNGVLSFPAGGIDPNTHADIAEPLTMVGPSAEVLSGATGGFVKIIP